LLKDGLTVSETFHVEIKSNRRAGIALPVACPGQVAAFVVRSRGYNRRGLNG
jgi:hypothetical protein